jgi:hypothetical protein
LQPVLQAFASNQIPTALLDPSAKAFLTAGGKYGGIFPGASNSLTHLIVGSNGNVSDYPRFLGGNNQPTMVREEIARLDHKFNDKVSIFGHWISEQIVQTYIPTMWSGDNVPSIGNTFGNPSYSGVAHAIFTISPSLVNETAFNYNGNRINILPIGLVTSPVGSLNKVFNGQNLDSRIPIITLNGSTGTSYSANWTPWTNAADDYQVRDDLSWTKGSHQIKVGFSGALYKKVQSIFTQTQGTFNFSGLFTGNDFADFLLGYSSGYSENATQDQGHWNNVSWAAYIQDNWRASRRLTFNLGLRWDGIPHTYEANNRYSDFYPNLYSKTGTGGVTLTAANVYNSDGTINMAGPAGAFAGTNPSIANYVFYLNGVGISGQPGIPKGMVNDSWKNFGPRLGVAYDLRGNGKSVVRAGFGMMYERVQGNDMYDGASDIPFSAGYSSTGAVLLGNARQPVGPGAAISGALPTVVGGYTGLDAINYAPPRVYQISAGVEQELAPRSVISIAYVGMRSTKQSLYQDINLPPASSLATLVANNRAGYNNLLPYLGFSSISQARDTGRGAYNGLQVDLHSQIKKDLSLQAAYTFSKAFDMVGPNPTNGYDLTAISNPYNPFYDYGASPFDRRHVFVANFVYSLPFMRHSTGAAKAVLGGWELSGVVIAETGTPVQMTLGNVGGLPTGSNGLAQGVNRPNFAGNLDYPMTFQSWFDPTLFSAPANGSWGNLQSNSVYGPGRHNWNLSVFKSFWFNEERGSKLELRAECFNIWNHRQFSSVSGNFTSGNFGAVTGAYDPRTLQLAVKFAF